MNYRNNGERVKTKKVFSAMYKVKLKNQKKHSTSKKIAISRVNTKRDFDDVYKVSTRGEAPQVVIR